MDHLFSSVVRVERMSMSSVDGTVQMTWGQAHDDDPQLDFLLGYLRCRLDLTFVRPGKDALPAVEAGRAQDRIGVLFTYAYAPLKAGDRVVAIPNAAGLMPVDGTFEIKTIPDKALDYSTAHHIEVQITETNTNLVGVWPGDDELEEIEP